MQDEDDRDLVAAFEQLRLSQSTFRRADPEEVRELEWMRFQILQAASTSERVRPLMAQQSSKSGSESASESASDQPSESTIAHVAMQLRLMERAFYVLQLQRYANARENHGWMNLFREWGRSEEFDSIYRKLQHTLTPDLQGFYVDYVRGHATIEDEPIPHPWLRAETDRGSGVFMDSGCTEPSMGTRKTRPGAGGVVDPKGGADRDQQYEKPSSDDPHRGGSSGANE